MDKMLRLLDAILDGYDTYQAPRGGDTFCNKSVQHVAGRLGYEKLKGMLANQIVDFLSRSADWEPVEMDKAQAYANEGRLVVAGLQAEPHGHVVVIRPGLEDRSAKWGNVVVPKASNVGANSYIGKHLAWGFQDKPKLWMLKEGVC